MTYAGEQRVAVVGCGYWGVNHVRILTEILGTESVIACDADVDRLDVRPGKGMLKLRAENSWEIQIDANSGAILQVAYRRSDLIESIHDGSFFGDCAKHWVFLPSALVLIGLWVTGMVLFFHPYVVKSRKRKTKVARLDPSEEHA